jgi:hypothetical protein
MFHKNAANSLLKTFAPISSHTAYPLAVEPTSEQAQGPRLVSAGERVVMSERGSKLQGSAVPELIAIASRRCSSFFAEAAVLVLVFGILDFFLQRGHIELAWVAGALGISVALLAASVGTDFTARRWLGAHP